MVAVDLRARQIADDDQRIAIRLERLEDRRELEVGARGRRRPLVHDHAVRDVDEPDALLRTLPRGATAVQRRHHRVEQRQRDAPRRRREGTFDEECDRLRDEHLCQILCTIAAFASVQLASSHLERHARHDPADERREPVVVGGRRHARSSRTAGMSSASSAAAERVGQQLLGHRAHQHLRPLQQRLAQRHHAVDLACRRRARPTHRSACPASCVRHAPTASKFSSARPSGSITLWQPAHAGLARCCSIRARTVFGAPGVSSGNGGTSGGGGGGGVPTGCRGSTCREPPATCDRRATSPAGCRPCRADLSARPQ